MKVPHKKLFSRLIQSWGVILIIGVAVSITFIDIIGTYDDFKHRAKKTREDYIAAQKQLIKQEVKRVVDLIDYEKSQSEILTKEKIKKRVHEAYAIAQNIYQKNRENKSKEDIQQMIIDALEAVRFNDGSGYFFAIRLDGIGVFFGERPELAGQNLLNIQDVHGQYIVKECIELVKQSGQGFYSYYWTKPNALGDDYKKISFVQYFKPYQWYLGSGLYVDDVEKKIRTTLLESISNIRFGKEGYIFINRFNGDALVSNGKVTFGKKLWDVFNKNPEQTKAIFDKEHAAALKPEGDYIYYSHIKLTTNDKESPKASFIYGIPDLQWLVGAGIYLDDIETDIALMQAELKEQIKRKIFFFSLAALVILCCFLFLFNRLNQKIKDDFRVLINFFEQAAFSDEPIDREQVHFDELDKMAADANEMLRNKIQAEKQLKMFKAFAESSNQGMGWSGLQGTLEYINPTLAALFGEQNITKALGKNVVTTYYPEKEQLRLKNEIIPRVIADGSWSGELIIQQANGTLLPTHNSIFLIRNATSETQVCANIITDISKRKKDEQEKEQLTEKLHQAKKMESIGLMAGGVAHDLNNILSGIVGYPELILQTLPEGSDLREPIEAIQQSGQRAATVVADLLTVARGAASTRELCNLNTLVHEYLNSPEAKKLQSLYPDILFDPQLHAVHANISCSPVHVKKCIMNLVTNASEAIGRKGTVFLSTTNQYIDESAKIEQKMHNGEYIILSVQDTGPGISNQDIQHIFEPFYSKKVMGRSGTGLGLTVVWNTMKDHDGKIFVESNEKGTYFKLYFPVCTKEEVLLKKNNLKEELRGNKELVLVVDDEPQLRDLASRMLTSLGYTAASVSSGELAIEFVANNPVDILVIDMLMEPGLNGRQTLERIISTHPKQKAIIASGFSESKEVKASLQLGARSFIKKPYSMAQLGRAIQEALKAAPA